MFVVGAIPQFPGSRTPREAAVTECTEWIECTECTVCTVCTVWTEWTECFEETAWRRRRFEIHSCGAHFSLDSLSISVALIAEVSFPTESFALAETLPQFPDAVVEAGKLVAAICHGPEMLVEADLIDGKDVTAWQSVEMSVVNAGATYHDVPAIKDGNILTGRCPDDLPDFVEAIVEAFEEEEVPAAADD